jgi:hypothetical protein
LLFLRQISATGHAQFHTSLSQIVKTKIDVAISKDIAGGSAKRLAKVKKTTE